MSFNLKSLLADALIIQSILTKKDESTLDTKFVTDPTLRAEIEKAALLKNLQIHKNIPNIMQGIKQSQDSKDVYTEIKLTDYGTKNIHNGFIETKDIDIDIKEQEKK